MSLPTPFEVEMKVTKIVDLQTTVKQARNITIPIIGIGIGIG